MTDAQFRALVVRVNILERRLGGFIGGGATVTPHATQHEAGGSDELDVTGLTGAGATIRITEQTPSGTGTVTFSSIPGTYRHLLIEFTARSTETATLTVGNLRFNSDSGSNYDGERHVQSTSATYAEQIGATSINAIAIPGATATASYASVGVMEIPYYAETTFFKGFMARMHYLIAQTTTNVQFRSYNGLWRSTSAITQIDIVLTAGNFVSGSKFTLYGIL